MDKYAIVVIAYNREKSLLRLLNSLNQACYGGDQTPLIISIDYSENTEVQRIAEKFEWKHGEKKLRIFRERQGLRRHVLQCGEYLQQYDAIAVFEDDLIVAPGFYYFMKEMTSFYKNDMRIAGISFYSHRWNPVMDRVFEPLRSDEDVFYMQYAQSWGQIWMKEQWSAFCEWYNRFDVAARQNLLNAASVPQTVARWPESSWLKYHIAYCIYENKYFVYPYDSLTTNCSEAGEHSRAATWRYQVSMQMAKRENYQKRPFSSDSIRYDAFFENQNIAKSVGIKEEELCVDLYGSKPGNMGKRYWLTSRTLDIAEKKDTFGLILRPMDANIFWHTAGNDFTLYEVEEEVQVHKNKKGIHELDYDIRGEGMSLKNVVPWILYKLNKEWKCKKA